MKVRIERQNGKLITICEIEDFDKDIVGLIELLKARRYRPLRVIVE